MITYASYNRFHNPVVSGEKYFCLIAKWTHQLLALESFIFETLGIWLCSREQRHNRPPTPLLPPSNK